MAQKITKQDTDNFIIEETKSQTVKSTIYVNIPIIQKEIGELEAKKELIEAELSNKKGLLQKVKSIK